MEAPLVFLWGYAVFEIGSCQIQICRGDRPYMALAVIQPNPNPSLASWGSKTARDVWRKTIKRL